MLKIWFFEWVARRTAKERIYTHTRNCTIRKWGIERLYEPTTIRFFRSIVRNVNYSTLVPEGPSRTCLFRGFQSIQKWSFWSSKAFPGTCQAKFHVFMWKNDLVFTFKAIQKSIFMSNFGLKHQKNARFCLFGLVFAYSKAFKASKKDRLTLQVHPRSLLLDHLGPQTPKTTRFLPENARFSLFLVKFQVRPWLFWSKFWSNFQVFCDRFSIANLFVVFGQSGINFKLLISIFDHIRFKSHCNEMHLQCFTPFFQMSLHISIVFFQMPLHISIVR